MPKKAIIASACTLILMACSPGNPMDELSQEQAIARAEQLLRDTAATLNPQAELEIIPSSVTPNPCLFSDTGIPERFNLARAYWLRRVPKNQNMAIAAQIRSYWEAEGHVITSTGGFEVGHPSIGAKSSPDGYTLALVWAEGDNLYIAATSPCIPSSTSNSTPRANTLFK